MKLPLRKLLLGLATTATISFAQWDVGQLYANTVKVGTNWGSARMSLDTLDLDVTVSGGIVRTRATMVWTPSQVATVTYRYEQSCAKNSSDSSSGVVYNSCFYRSIPETTLVSDADSLEMRGYFQLPFDAAATGLWLWVGGEKQTAYVMDRWLASQQYAQVVGRRRDPALLESWGNGSFNLSLFPLKSRESRKMQIEIVQAWKEGIALPFVSRSVAQVYDYASGTYVAGPKAKSFVRLSLRSDDATPVALDLGALGRIQATSQGESRTWQDPDSLVATFSGKPAEVWTAVRDGKGAVGGATTFRGDEIRFQAEPVNRLLVLDGLDSAGRTKKLALLAALKYGRAPHKLDIAWFDGTKLVKLWNGYRSIDSASAREVLAFLKAWNPIGAPDAKGILERVVKSDTGSVVVLVSTSPYASMTWNCVYPYPTTDSVSLATYSACSDAYSRKWQEIQNGWTDLGKRMASAGQTLFGWWNDWSIYNASSATGGFSFGSVSYPWSYWWWAGDSISAPAMYGPRRFGYRESPTNLTLQIEGISTDSLAYLFQPSYGYVYWGWGGVFITARPGVLLLADRKAASAGVSFAARSASDEFPGRYDDSLPLVWSARYLKGGNANLKVSGTWGGLRFQATRPLRIPEPSGTEWGSRLWAGEYANMIQPWIWSDTSSQAAARRIGKGYGIVTSATSFLALEPGVSPLDSLSGLANGTSDATTGKASSYSIVAGSTADSLAVSSSGSALENASLEDLLAGRISSVRAVAVPQVGLKVHAGAGIELEILGHDDRPSHVRILDLKGREVANLPVARTGDHWTASWNPAGRGVYIAVAEGSLWKHTSTFAVGR